MSWTPVQRRCRRSSNTRHLVCQHAPQSSGSAMRIFSRFATVSTDIIFQDFRIHWHINSIWSFNSSGRRKRLFYFAHPLDINTFCIFLKTLLTDTSSGCSTEVKPPGMKATSLFVSSKGPSLFALNVQGNYQERKEMGIARVLQDVSSTQSITNFFSIHPLS